jgi:hypothetical protein
MEPVGVELVGVELLGVELLGVELVGVELVGVELGKCAPKVNCPGWRWLQSIPLRCDLGSHGDP